MNFLSWQFLTFIALFLSVYWAIPKKYRYLMILGGSLFFYGYHDRMVLLILGASVLITYLGGRALEKWPFRRVFALFFTSNIFILVFFKYTNFIISNADKLLSFHVSEMDILLPVGLSFYIFQSTSYLSDVYRRHMPAERNFLRYAAFVSFFPTILSGPIQKSRNLLPQIKAPADFSYEQAVKGLILFLWGAFEKICVANRLLVIINTVFLPDTYRNYGTAHYIVAAVSFSIYIYADFSSYSDMARGIAKFMGIDVGRNFLTPYLSTSLSEFWRRWHVSLNDWFVENIYIPLGGSRRGKWRKYFNIMVVFFISGFWHGAAWHFVVWGVANGFLMVLGEIMKPFKSSFYKKVHVDEHSKFMIFFQRLVVFWLITITWVFFRNGVKASLHIIERMTWFSPVKLFRPDLFTICGSVTQTFLTMLFVAVFYYVQCRRYDFEESATFFSFAKQPLIFQWTVLGALLSVVIFMHAAAGTSVNTTFLYFNF